MVSIPQHVTFNSCIVTSISRRPDRCESILTRNLHNHRKSCFKCRCLDHCEEFEELFSVIKGILFAGEDGRLYSSVKGVPWKVIVEVPRYYYYVHIMLFLERDNREDGYNEEV